MMYLSSFSVTFDSILKIFHVISYVDSDRLIIIFLKLDRVNRLDCSNQQSNKWVQILKGRILVGILYN